MTKEPIPLKEDDIPVSMKHLSLVKQELKSDIATLSLEMREGFAQMNARFTEQFVAMNTKMDTKFAEVDARFAIVNTKFADIDTKFASIDVQIQKLDTKVTQVLVVSQEQNDRNKVVMDGYITVYEKFIETHNRFRVIEKHVGLP